MKITQKRANYNTTVGDSGFSGNLHDMARDFSMLNRKGLTQTTSKGVPYVFTLAVTTYPSLVKNAPTGGANSTDYLYDGTSQESAMVTNVFYGAGNNWLYRNGAVKTHAAREQMFRDSEVSKEERGAYDKTIRYKFTSSGSYNTPLKGTISTAVADGQPYVADDMVGGTWDYSKLIFPDDTNGAFLHLCGAHASEESTTTFSSLCLPQLYLSSRQQVEGDSNAEDNVTPYKSSVLNKMLSKNFKGVQDEVTELARTEQDNPPYHADVIGGAVNTTLNNDLYSEQEIGRSQFTVGQGNSSTTIIEAPFGLFEMQSIVSNVDIGTAYLDYSVELLGITEM